MSFVVEMTYIDGIQIPNSTAKNTHTAIQKSQHEHSRAYNLLETSVDKLLSWIQQGDQSSQVAQSSAIAVTMDGIVVPRKVVVDIFLTRLGQLASGLQTLIISILHIIGFALNTIAYKLYIVAVESVELVRALPSHLKKRYSAISELAYIIRTKDLRELYFLEIKLNVRLALQKITSFLSVAKEWVKKYYLACTVVLAMALLGISSVAGKTNATSILQAATTKNAVTQEVKNVGLGGGVLISRTLATNANVQSGNLIIEHTVKEGDTLDYLSKLYAVQVETITFNNKIENATIAAGQKIYIPPMDAYISVIETDTSKSDLARVYKVDAADIDGLNPDFVATNNLKKGNIILLPISDFNLVKQYQADEKKRVDDANRQSQWQQTRQQALAGVAYKQIEYLDPTRVADLGFVLPVPSSCNSAYSRYGHLPHNNARDFGCPNGTEIYSISSGVVVEVKSGYPNVSNYSWGYANHIVIDHGQGYRSVYAHLSEVKVNVGDQIEKGQFIGLSGMSGWSTGAHLHFELRKDGAWLKPEWLIPSINYTTSWI